MSIEEMLEVVAVLTIDEWKGGGGKVYGLEVLKKLFKSGMTLQDLNKDQILFLVENKHDLPVEMSDDLFSILSGDLELHINKKRREV